MKQPSRRSLNLQQAIPHAEVELIATVDLTAILPDYDDPEDVAECRWVRAVASFHHRTEFEFVLNLANDLDPIPERLQEPIRAAREAGMAYVIVHQGT